MKIFDFKKEINILELDETSKCLINGGLVIFPTETVYGLGADARNKAEVGNIFMILREMDKFNPENVIIEGVSYDGLGLAIMNRLIRACSHNFTLIE